MTRKHNAKLPLDEAVDRFAAEADRPFSLDEAVQQVLPRLKSPPGEPPRAIEAELDQSPWVLYDTRTERYVPRRAIFRGARFRVAPTPQEIREGVLVPGHRFMPFLPRSFFPPKASLCLADGTPIGTRRVRRPLKDVLICLSLFGQQGAIEYVATEAPDNAEALAAAEDPEAVTVTLTVFDMRAVYERHSVCPWDSFLLRVDDWTAGRFTLEEHTPAATVDKAVRRDWCHALDKSLLGTFNAFGATLDVSEQLAHALFNGDPCLLQAPACHFGGFLAESEDVQLAALSMGAVLWRRGESPEDAYLDHVDLPVPTGRRDSLAAISSDLGLTFSEQEVAAYMRDELFGGGRDLNAVVARCLAGRDVVFYDEEQERAFHRFLRRLWTRIGRNYNRFQDVAHGPLRRRVLKLLDRQTAWLRKLDREATFVDDLPDKSMSDLATLMTLVDAMLTGLNGVDALKPEEERQMTTMLTDLEHRADALMRGMDVELGKSRRPKLSVVAPADEDRRTVHQLKITLIDSRPPVWRRVLVESGASLADLHGVIQACMGWADSHAHAFTVGGRTYGDPAAPEGDSNHGDEVGVTLEQALPGSGERITYVYDPDDAWSHRVEAEAIVSLEDGATYPRCVSGERACPPEDCGGLGAYQRLLRLLKDPQHRNRPDVREWLGEAFDPEAFDAEAVNRRLAAFGSPFSQ